VRDGLLGWTEDFLTDIERRGLKPKSMRLYRTVLKVMNHRDGLKLETVEKTELLESLDRFRKTLSPRYYILRVYLIKRALQFLGRKDLADLIPTPKQPDPAESIKIIPLEDIDRLIREAPRLRDRLLIELLHETGARRGEITVLRIKDIQFDEFGAILWLRGKTGTRRRRVYASVPDLRAYLNDHPHRSDPEAAFFLRTDGLPFTERTLYGVVTNLSKRVLKRHIHPHQFRHTRATEDCRYFTDREMMMLFGWKRLDMVGVYSHLSMRDVEDKDLVLHGLKRKEEVLRPLVKIQVCHECSQENAPVAIYCVQCGAVLPNEQLAVMKKLLNDPPFIESVMKRVLEQVAFKS
jgi:integrase